MQVKMLFKFLVLGFVAIVLMVVLSSVKGLELGRKARLEAVRHDIASSYAGAQWLAGPVFAVTFTETWSERLYNEEKDSWYDKEMSRTGTRLFYPQTLSYDTTMQVQERYRGIFKANVFQTRGHLKGQVLFPALETLAAGKESRIEPVSARACFLFGDLRGITRVPGFTWNDQALEVLPGSELEAIGQGIHADLPDIEALFGGTFAFGMELDLHGMGSFEFVPIGAENEVRMASDWPHPSFTGEFLANERSVSEAGFEAEWSVNGLASSARQQLDAGGKKRLQRLGVELVDPVNIYAMTDRALKYGFLFIFITFSAFALFEMLAQLRIHPVQYGLVGLAQAVFFLLLLSLSEHVGFGHSYLAASAGTIGLLVFYVCHVLRGLGRGLAFGVLLGLLYGVLYMLLQSEDHALVAGSVFIFGLMGLVMLLTRKVDWYALGSRAGA